MHPTARERARATPKPNFASAQESRKSPFGRLALSTTKITNSQSESVLDSDLKTGDLEPVQLKPVNLKLADLHPGDLKPGPEGYAR